MFESPLLGPWRAIPAEREALSRHGGLDPGQPTTGGTGGIGRSQRG